MNSDQRLMSAVVEGRIYQTRLLLQLGARAEFKDEYGYSPLLRACQIDDKKQRTRSILIRLLVEYGANVNTSDPDGHHALAYSCIHCKDDIVHLLLEISLHDIDLNQQDLHGNTPLFHAVRNGNIHLVKLLVECMNNFHIDMHTRNNDDRTPYLEAVRLGRTECAKLLLQKGHASTTVLVNPFLTEQALNSKAITTKKRHEKGRERNGKANRQRSVSNDIYHREMKSQRENITPSCKLTKRQLNTREVNENQSKKHTDQLTSIEESCNQNGEVAVDPTRIQKHSPDSCLATEKITLVQENSVVRTRPNTAFIRRTREYDMVNLPCRVFLTDDDNGPTMIKDIKHIPRHTRSRTAPPRRSSAPSINTQSSASWYSHFTVTNPPSVNFLTMIMSLYGEQCSPESSYRKGFKTDDLTSHAPVIVGLDQELDKPTEGRRSSSGSIRSMTGLNRNKIHALHKTPSIPNKKLWAAVLKSRS